MDYRRANLLRGGDRKAVEKPPTTAMLKLPPEELERARRIAARRGLSLSAFLRFVVLKEVDRFDGPNRPATTPKERS